MDTIVEVILAIAGICVALKNIVGFIRDNYNGGRKVVDTTFERKFKEELDECLPAIISEGNQQLVKSIQPQFDRINGAIAEQSDHLDLLSEDMCEVKTQVETTNAKIELLNTSTKDVMRKEMLEIYRRGKAEKRIGRSELSTFNQLFADYSAEGGNSYIKDINDRIQAWDIYEDY